MTKREPSVAKRKPDVALHMTRKWAMPNKETFTIAPIRDLIGKYIANAATDSVWIDPFVRNSVFKSKMKYTNDLNPEFTATHHMDALDFLKQIEDTSVGGVLFDPPYSARQVSECYKGVGRNVTSTDTQSSFYSKLKKEITRIIRPGGTVISFGWNSNGMGLTNGFEMVELLLVSHGGHHNDTIVTVEKKN